jgi:hypothetical protein
VVRRESQRWDDGRRPKKQEKGKEKERESLVRRTSASFARMAIRLLVVNIPRMEIVSNTACMQFIPKEKRAFRRLLKLGRRG